MLYTETNKKATIRKDRDFLYFCLICRLNQTISIQARTMNNIDKLTKAILKGILTYLNYFLAYCVVLY